MTLYAISDFHLSLSTNKKMDVFGDNWANHHLKIKENFEKIVKDDDIVVIHGDISWAKNMDEFIPDLEFIHSLKGRKIISKGNHDFYWGSTDNLNYFFDDITFIKNGTMEFDDFNLCFNRGWLCPNDKFYKESDFKTYKKEVVSLEKLLKKIDNNKKILLSTHFPPTNDKREDSGFTKLIDEYEIDTVFYGHLHGLDSFNSSFQGFVNKTNYILVSSDYLDFKPKKIIDF